MVDLDVSVILMNVLTGGGLTRMMVCVCVCVCVCARVCVCVCVRAGLPSEQTSVTLCSLCGV